jgi:preprotein translocase subunit SecG
LGEIKVPSYLVIAQILVAVVLIGVLLLQVKGGGLGGIFGQPDSVYRTKRGIEKTLFQLTIGLVVLFVILSIVVVRIGA